MIEDATILFLIDRVAERIGFRSEAIPYASAVKALKSRFPRGLSTEDLRRRAEEGDPEVERALLEAVSVGETFFFRQPEHFRYLAETFAPRFSKEVLRAWSAGCATGEEAYSLASCLLASVPETAQVHILGTDVTERNVMSAVRGVYGSWSVREAGPILHPTFGSSELGSFSVNERVRAATSFRTHNLLEEAPAPQSFDVVFCRNVLLYFSPEAAELACERIVGALAPGGLVAFGTLDVARAPAGTEPVGPRGSNLFVKSAGRRTRAPRKMSMRSAGRASRHSQNAGADPHAVVLPKAIPPPIIIVESPDQPWIDEHLRALGSIEQGNLARAEALLEALRRRAPAYIPALFELGVLCARRHQRGRAEALMRELLRRTEVRDPRDPVPGPEELTVAYYRVAAEAYLGFAPGQEDKR
jgi:chemotaxis methyl-accepting protein methylase